MTTINTLPENYRGKVKLYVSTNNPHAMLRILLLLFVLGDMGEAGVDLVVHIWYDTVLPDYIWAYFMSILCSRVFGIQLGDPDSSSGVVPAIPVTQYPSIRKEGVFFKDLLSGKYTENLVFNSFQEAEGMDLETCLSKEVWGAAAGLVSDGMGLREALACWEAKRKAWGWSDDVTEEPPSTQGEISLHSSDATKASEGGCLGVGE